MTFQRFRGSSCLILTQKLSGRLGMLCWNVAETSQPLSESNNGVSDNIGNPSIGPKQCRKGNHERGDLHQWHEANWLIVVYGRQTKKQKR